MRATKNRGGWWVFIPWINLMKQLEQETFHHKDNSVNHWSMAIGRPQGTNQSKFWSYTFSQQIATPLKFDIAPNKKVVGRLLSFLKC